MIGKKRQKKPHWLRSPSDKKVPRQREDPLSTENQRITWHINTVDREGPWGWGVISSLIFWSEIWHKVRWFETMSWAEIKKNRENHSISVERLCPEAQGRLLEIQQDDITELFSLRLSGRKRVWGIRDGSILKVLWWDPDHTVYPYSMKHT